MATATARSAAGSSICKPPTTLAKMSWSASEMRARLLSTAVISSRRLKSTPLAVRRGWANAVVLVSACTSTRMGRVPSIVTAIAEPGALGMRSARNASDGLRTSARPFSAISKTPTSLVEPKRFLTERSSRKEWNRSPSR
ncbi:MAG: hypothetical protein BWY52_02822 [Chloroflexi bacterium ADurb.Bin325]|nr:MAG: hypothetical protein BWY52_02822 [Chloroflexi bacterium ADurb.Bin325]